MGSGLKAPASSDSSHRCRAIEGSERSVQGGGGKVMAEPSARHLSLPSGLLELCALLGASQDSLQGLEQVRGETGN